MRDMENLIVPICFMVTMVAVSLVLAIKLDIKDKKISILEQEKSILIEGYLCNIQDYRRPLWKNEKQLIKFKKELRIRAIREINQ